MESVHSKISDVQDITKQALINLDRSERRIRRWTLITSVAVFVTSLLLVLLIFTYGSQQLHQIHAQQQALQQQGNNIAQSLQILKEATNPATVEKNHLQLEELIYCIVDKIDVDTGKVAAIDPICKPILAKPPATIPLMPPSNTSKTTTTSTTIKTATRSTGIHNASVSQPINSIAIPGPQGPTGAQGPPGPQGPAGKNAFPFSFSFSDGLKTYNCTIESPTVGSCSSSFAPNPLYGNRKL